MEHSDHQPWWRGRQPGVIVACVPDGGQERSILKLAVKSIAVARAPRFE